MERIFPGRLLLMRVHSFVTDATELATMLIYHRHEEGIAVAVEIGVMLLLLLRFTKSSW